MEKARIVGKIQKWELRKRTHKNRELVNLGEILKKALAKAS